MRKGSQDYKSLTGLVVLIFMLEMWWVESWTAYVPSCPVCSPLKSLIGHWGLLSYGGDI